MPIRNYFVTVVVCVKDDLRIYRLIESLVNQTMSKASYEIIIVENGSSMFGDIINLGKNVRYLHTSKANRAAARNIGLQTGRGDLLLMTDADCVAAPDWIERMSKQLTDGTFGAVGGAIRKYQPHSLTQRYGITIVDGQKQLNYLPALPLPYVASANAGYITALLREVGGFDEAFESGEDVDICYRLGLQGYKVGIVPEAVIWHEDRTSLRAHFWRFCHYAKYQVLLFAKYKSVSGKKYVINPYPFARLFKAIMAIPWALVQMLRGERAPAAIVLLQIIEAAGVWYGDILGSIRYRQLYL